MSRLLVHADWDDAPHLTEAAKHDLVQTIPLYQRDARTAGIPALGSGVIYPISQSELTIDDFDIPRHWVRAFGLDAGGGSKATAIVWGALDREAQILYVYACYKRATPETAIHIAALQARGKWMPGVGDAAALVITQYDAEQLINVYKQAGVDIELPDKSVETGITDVFDLMSAGRFKVFRSCKAWFEEQRLYRRDGKGRIIKKNDHLMDATRYLVRSGVARMKAPPADDNILRRILGGEKRSPNHPSGRGKGQQTGWMK